MAASTEPKKGNDMAGAGGSSSASASASAAPSKRLLACIECRRRKQKASRMCDYGMPCVHCAKRFPQPACKYPSRNSRKKKTGASTTAVEKAKTDEPLSGVVSESYSHLDIDGVKDVIIQLDKSQIDGEDDDDWDLESGSASPESSASSQWQQCQHGHVHRQQAAGQPPSVEEAVRVAVRLATRDKPGTVDSTIMLNAFSELLPHPEGVVSRSEVEDWMMDLTTAIRAQNKSSTPGPRNVVGGGEGYLSMPLSLTNIDKRLIRTHLQLLSRFKASLDGCPDPENRFMRHWVPFTLSDPLLLQTVLFTASCFLHEWGHVPHEVVLMHKHRVYRRLNAALASSDGQSSDAAILALEQIVINSWLWSGSKDLQAHIQGLKTMIRLRGGFQKLGMQGFLSKLIIINDITLALTHEIDPFMYQQPGFEYEDPFMTPLQRTHNSPLLFDAPSFFDPTAALELHPGTAQILDDMRTLLRTVLSLPETPTIEELKTAHATATLIYQRIDEMPKDILVDDNKAVLEYPTPPSTVEEQTNEKDHKQKRPSPPASKNNGSAHGREDDKREGSSSKSDSSSPTALPQTPDLAYRCVRRVALIYCRAILTRTPTSRVCDVHEFLDIWSSMWQNTMASWNKIIGIFMWALVAIVPSCDEAPKVRFVETLLTNGFMATAVENWHVALEAAETALRLQKWLRGGIRSLAKQHGKGGFAGKALRYGEKQP